MSEYITIARPYAKAAFDFAIEHSNVNHWQTMLKFVAALIKNEQIINILSGMLTPTMLADFLIAICGKQLDVHGQNFIRIMAHNNRLKILPEVFKEFQHLCSINKAIIEVEVISANPLSDRQLAKIAVAMEKRLSSKVKINHKIDKSIIIGIILRFNDIVIDGSIRGRLDRLTDFLRT